MKALDEVFLFVKGKMKPHANNIIFVIKYSQVEYFVIEISEACRCDELIKMT